MRLLSKPNVTQLNSQQLLYTGTDPDLPPHHLAHHQAAPRKLTCWQSHVEHDEANTMQLKNILFIQ